VDKILLDLSSWVATVKLQSSISMEQQCDDAVHTTGSDHAIGLISQVRERTGRGEEQLTEQCFMHFASTNLVPYSLQDASRQEDVSRISLKF
jgi:hypothetical protein